MVDEDGEFFPKLIDSYTKFFGTYIDGQFERVYELKKNLGYNAQYIEYLIYILSEEEPFHSVLKKQLKKTLILTCSTSVESMIYCFLKGSDKNKKKTWYDKEKYTSNCRVVDGAQQKTETKVLRQIDPIDDYMTFDWMIQKSRRIKLLGEDETVYKSLKKLKELRNKIHLFSFKHRLDTDFNNFTSKNADLAIETYQSVLYSNHFDHTNHSTLFDFLETRLHQEVDLPF